MFLSEDQELRRVLALRVLRRCSDPQRAVSLAARLERYVIHGRKDDAPKAQQSKAPPVSETLGRARDQRPPGQSEDLQLHRLAQENPSVIAATNAFDTAPSLVYGHVRPSGLAQDGSRARRSEQPSKTRPVVMRLPQADSESTSDDGPVGIDSVVCFLRSRDYSVVKTADGRYKLDERQVLTAKELFHRANKVRERLGRPAWTKLLGHPE